MGFRITGLPAEAFSDLFSLSDRELTARGAVRRFHFPLGRRCDSPGIGLYGCPQALQFRRRILLRLGTKLRHFLFERPELCLRFLQVPFRFRFCRGGFRDRRADFIGIAPERLRQNLREQPIQNRHHDQEVQPFERFHAHDMPAGSATLFSRSRQARNEQTR